MTSRPTPPGARRPGEPPSVPRPALQRPADRGRSTQAPALQKPSAQGPSSERPAYVPPQTYVSADARTARALPGVSLADRRGLTAAGGVVLSVLLGLAGATFDVLTGSGLRTAFAGCFVAGAVLTALLVHREDLGAAAVMPPLVYVGLSLGIGAVARTANAGSFVLQQALELVNAVVLGAPVLLLGTAAAALIAGARWLGSRGT